jgi:hypothetical protein
LDVSDTHWSRLPAKGSRGPVRPNARSFPRKRESSWACSASVDCHWVPAFAGPAAGGLYRVRIAETKLPKADLERRMQSLQSDKIIGFIAPTE